MLGLFLQRDGSVRELSLSPFLCQIENPVPKRLFLFRGNRFFSSQGLVAVGF